MVAYNTVTVRDNRSPTIADAAEVSRPIVRDNRTDAPPPVRVRTVDTHQVSAHIRPRQAAQADFDNIFARNDLSIEDKVMMLLFAVMSKMDAELTTKSKNLGKAKSDAPTANGPGGTSKANPDSAANGASSQDQQALELQQLVSRRNNLFATLNAIVNKFDDSAAKVIQKLGQG